MFKVTTGPQFHASFDPKDPSFSIVQEVAEKAANDLALQIDEFVRKAIAKVIPQSSLDLFVESRSAFPGLDMNMELLSVHTRRITVLFQGRQLGQALFVTLYNKKEGEWVITHEMSEVII